MRLPLPLLLIVCLSVAQSLAQSPPVNYLLEAFESAMNVKADYESEATFFRERLTWQADDLAYYFTVRMRYALNDAYTEAQGAGLRECAAVAAHRSLDLVNRFDESLRRLEEDASGLQVTVYEELMATNVRVEGMDTLYYLHNYRMEEAKNRLFEVHQVELGNRWAEMWFAYFDIGDELDACIAESMASK